MKFISLRWKLLLTITMVMFINFIAIYIITTQTQKRNFESTRKQQHTLQRRLIEEILFEKLQELESLQRSATAILQLSNTPEKGFAAVWSSLRKHSSIHGVVFFDSENEKTNEFYKSNIASKIETPEKHYFFSAKDNEDIQLFYRCHKRCAIVSLSHQKLKEENYYLLIEIRLKKAINKFSYLSHSQMAILSKEYDPLQPNFWIKNLKRRLDNAKNMMETRALLSKLNDFQPGIPYLLHADETIWDIYPLSAVTDAFDIVILTNITNEYQQLNKNIVHLGLVSLVLSLLILLLMSVLTRKPLQRLLSLSKALPGLASGNYERLRQEAKKSAKALIPDELSIITNTTIDVSRQLENLEQERELALKNLEHISHHDSLTNLLTRRYFDEISKKLIADKIPFQLLFLDLNEFKRVNDQLGHSEGDRFLVYVAKKLCEQMPKEAIICRLGGDEFAIIDKTYDTSLLPKSLEDFSGQLENLLPQGLSQNRRSQIAMGAASFPKDADNLHDLLNCADRAMYKAKTLDTQRVCYYRKELKQELYSQADKRNFIRTLINKDLLEIYLQPIICLENNSVFGFECLSRPVKSGQGEINQGIEQIIQYAEQAGIMPELDLYIINKILQSLRLSQFPPAPQYLCINLSACSIVSETFGQQLTKLLENSNTDPERIVLEITETAKIDDRSAVQSFMANFGKIGMKFSLDDFGDGFASFSYLRNLPFDIVKIDGSFIKNLGQNEKDDILVDAMINTAKQFNMLIIAEYVENRSIERIIRAKGIQFGQGHYFSPPLAHPSFSQ